MFPTTVRIYAPVHILYLSLSLPLCMQSNVINAMRYNAVQCNVMECYACI
jgi:hypothetical protein